MNRENFIPATLLKRNLGAPAKIIISDNILCGVHSIHGGKEAFLRKVRTCKSHVNFFN